MFVMGDTNTIILVNVNQAIGRKDLSEKSQEIPQPPQPPVVGRRLHLYPYQIIGLPILIMIPILALLGVLSQQNATVKEASADFDVTLEYPIRCFYRMSSTMELSIRNTSTALIPAIRVSLERSYMRAFDSIQFIPDSVTLTEGAYIIELNNVSPGETRRISIDYQPKRYWQHQGNLNISADGAAPVEIPLQTFVFP
jgi:hypothetical protein